MYIFFTPFLLSSCLVEEIPFLYLRFISGFVYFKVTSIYFKIMIFLLRLFFEMNSSPQRKQLLKVNLNKQNIRRTISQAKTIIFTIFTSSRFHDKVDVKWPISNGPFSPLKLKFLNPGKIVSKRVPKETNTKLSLKKSFLVNPPLPSPPLNEIEGFVCGLGACAGPAALRRLRLQGGGGGCRPSQQSCTEVSFGLL